MLSLSFADVAQINHHTIEITPNKGVEISSAEIAEYRCLLLGFGGDATVLINRQNGFSFSIYSLPKILRPDNVLAVAMVARERYTYAISTSDIRMILDADKPLEVFYDRTAALAWLDNQHRLALAPPEPPNTATNAYPDLRLEMFRD